MKQFRELAKAISVISDALGQIDAAALERAEKKAERALDRLKIHKDSAGYSYNDRDFNETDKALAAAMSKAGRAKALAMGQRERADQIARALGTIHTHRAILCSLAAAAVVELAGIARDAQERG